MRKGQIKSEAIDAVSSNKEEYRLFSFQYTMCSSNGYEEGSQLINEYKLKISWIDDSDNEILAGQGKISHVLIDQMIGYQWNIYVMLDSVNAHLPEVVSSIFDFDKNEFLIHELGEAFSSNICVIEELHILEKFRGKRIGTSLLADISLRFGGDSSCIVFKSFPMQFDNYHLKKKDAFTLGVLAGLPSKKGKAQLSLTKHYESLGFKPSPHDLNIFYLSTAKRNLKLDKILDPLVWNKG